MQYFGEDCKLGKIEAEGMLAGIMLDTKNFTIKVGVRTFEAAVFLKKLGADPIEVRKFFASSLALYQKKAQIVVNAEKIGVCAVSECDFETDIAKIVSVQAADELLEIVGIEASFVIYRTEKTVNIAARSSGKINVQEIMEHFGGGGHRLQAACQILNSEIEKVKKELLEIIEQF